MKLYTEEQVREAYLSGMYVTVSFEEVLQRLTPIELPSDEEIYGMELGTGMHDFYKGGFIEGAKWVINKILNK